ncbi:unnamed protein product [Notodromas monacha]|uniref:Glutamate--cysteine ligase n=1 Tax=Notodromas monacha TaxID=399045 RepID=A0A7R9GFJ8_9CRUS|nr:unnamed protein product [Notodromas monacha]CAG0920851.1 unnamed protein product [Notodromas monacha]
MGLLSEGKPLSWEETKKYAQHVREHGILQFINQYHRLKNRAGDILLWGDEVKYCILKEDPENKAVRVSLRGKELLDELNQKELAATPGEQLNALWRLEYGAYMIEGTPGVPYGGLMAHFNIVEANMKARRNEVNAILHPDEFLLSTNTGVAGRAYSPGTAYSPRRKISPHPRSAIQQSLFCSDHLGSGIFHSIQRKVDSTQHLSPGVPYGGLMAHFNIVEANMKARRNEVNAILHPDEFLLSVTAFPRLGCPNFTYPALRPTPASGASRSLFFPDGAIFPGHPRFKTLTRNIRSRRGEKVAINMPSEYPNLSQAAGWIPGIVFRDVNTPDPFVEDFSALGDDGEAARANEPNHVYMDAMGFGMGCCCLQVTFQACNIDEGRRLYDQLAVLCPIMLALSAASPVYRGYLVDRDCRWNVVSASVDCRTKEERGLLPLTNDRFRIQKSRYDSIDSYISKEGEPYNDIELVYDPDIYAQLRAADVDHLLAQHIAHLFIRDPISLFQEKLHQNDEEEVDHFENIQSTNWQTMRFKIPPPKSSIGWRVEFRPCEVQLTDFENAAYVVFVVLLTRVILSYELNFLMPLSKVDENMKRAQRRDAVLSEKFWFRRRDLHNAAKNQNCDENGALTPSEMCSQAPCAGPDCAEMTLNEIINGKDGEFPGLIPLMQAYLTTVEVDTDTHCTVTQYLRLIRDRASGELKTTAKWIRDFVASHASYKWNATWNEKDSVVSEDINYDLMVTCREVSEGRLHVPELLGPQGAVRSKTNDDIPRAIKMASQIYDNGRRVVPPSGAASVSDAVGAN